MASAGRSRTGNLTHFERLAESPETHHIFHALRVIEARFADAPRFGESRRPREDHVRLQQEPELAFPPSSIRGFEPPKDKAPGRLNNRFFGLFGPHGPLPLHLTEYARDRKRNHRDPTFTAFANMLTHRLMGLLYRAWTAGQPAPDFDRGARGSLENKVAALAGLHGSHLSGRDAMPDLSKRHFAGLLALGPKNPEGLIAILSAFFRAPVKLQQFVGSWLELEPDDRWQMGARAGLGKATSIGDRVWSRAAKFRIRIGPVSLEDYRRMLPGTSSLGRLDAIVRNYVGDALDWDVNLVLQAEDVPAAVLGQTTRLGHVSWIGERKNSADADDLYLTPLR